MWGKDLSRTVDYLETRSDIDISNLGYFGVSWGGAMGAIMLAIEKRIQVAILNVGGFYMVDMLPEVDQINYAPRINIPLLMLNGKYDHVFPLELSQKPMFNLIGASKEDKNHIIFESGHFLPRHKLIKESLNWLEKYQGSVMNN